MCESTLTNRNEIIGNLSFVMVFDCLKFTLKCKLREN